MRKHVPFRAFPGFFLLCAFLYGCTQPGWSGREIFGLSGLCLALTCIIVFAANRLTLDAAGPPKTGRLGPVLCFAGLFSCILGAKLNLINSFGSDLPFWDDYDVFGPLFSSYLRGDLTLQSLLSHFHEHILFFTRLFCLNLLELGGQWDPLVQMAVNAFVHSMILTYLCLVLWRLAGRRHLAQFAILTAILGVLPYSWENTLLGMESNFYCLLGYSILAMLLLVGSDLFSIPWFLGAAAVLCAQLSLGSGFLAPAAAACVIALRCLMEPRRLKKHLPAIAFLVLLCIFGYGLLQHAPVHDVLKPKGLLNLLKSFGKCASWPFFHWAAAPILWAPFLVFAWRWIRARKAAGTFEQFILVLGIWTLLQAAAMAYSRGYLFSRYLDFIAMAPLVNIVALIYLLDPLVGKAPRLAAVAAGAAGLIACAGIVGLELKLPGAIAERHEFNRIEEANLGRYILTGDPSSIMDKPLQHIPHQVPETLIEVLEDPLLRDVLPPCIRLPLRLEPVGGLGFAPGSVPPELPDLPHRVVVGSWKADGVKPSASFASRPVVSGHSWLVFDVAGGGPGISLELEPTSGGTAVPVPVMSGGGGWRQVIARAPEGSFILRAVDESGNGWVAFTWPRELAATGFYARQLFTHGPAVTVVGLLVLFAGIIIAFKEEMALRPARL